MSIGLLLILIGIVVALTVSTLLGLLCIVVGVVLMVLPEVRKY